MKQSIDGGQPLQISNAAWPHDQHPASIHPFRGAIALTKGELISQRFSDIRADSGALTPHLSRQPYGLFAPMSD